MRSLTWLARLALVVAAGALLVTGVVVGVAPRAWRVANSHSQVPVTLPAFAALAQRTIVYDVAGNEIAAFEQENSQPIPYAQIPDTIVRAFLAVEDRSFFEHHGINVRSLVRATLSNLNSDSGQQGASTITMQVVKNDFLAGLERDGRYKLLQIHYALMLERAMPKEQILERYLNTVFFGNNAYGIQAAAETYFGTTVDQLSFTQAAFLAGLVRSPSGYDPINNPQRSRFRFAQVLEALVDNGDLPQEEADATLDTFQLPERVQRPSQIQTRRTYYTEALRDYLLNRSTILGDSYEARFSALYRGGLRIHTTLDPVKQAQAEEARNLVPPNGANINAAIVSLDTRSGAIRAMVGGTGFVPGENEVNMAISPRQTGSSVKLFILAAALQAGAQGSDVINGNAPCILPNPMDPEKPFEITDAVSASGTLADMTARSINCAYARLSQIVGLNRVVDTMYRLANSAYLYKGQPRSEHPLIEPFASLATGANEMSPLDMASGAQSIANEGIHHEPYYVDFIDNADGSRYYTHEDPGSVVLDRDVALRAIAIMKGTLEYGTGRRFPLDNGRPAAGKTGTQANNTNAWFVGFTPELTTAVWMGNPDRYVSMVGIPELGNENVQGGRLPTRIWKTYMDAALAGSPISDWEAPPPEPRAAAKLYLPGNECLAAVTGYRTGGFRAPEQQAPPDTTTPPAQPQQPGQPGQPGQPVVTQPPQPIYSRVESGTTIPPDVVDPRWPLTTAPMQYAVVGC